MRAPGGRRAVSSRANREGAVPQMYRSGVLTYSRAQGFRILDLLGGDAKKLERVRPRGGDPAHADGLAQHGERHGEVETSPAPRLLREGNHDAPGALHGLPPGWAVDIRSRFH